MDRENRPGFQFRNTISPIYIEPLLIPIQYGRWYSTAQLVELLRSSRFGVEGSDIVSHNMSNWALIGLGKLQKRKLNRVSTNIFRLSELGKQIIDTYSTNAELFYDLIHFLFYSAYYRSNDMKRSSLWLYAKICGTLWYNAPGIIDNSSLTNSLQIEVQEIFPTYTPSFSERSVRGVFPWLQTLSPPFLSKQSNKSQLFSKRRSHCTPQLFHLATDMIYNVMEGVQYGSSLAINEQQIEDICKVCLLDQERFWNMANLTEMTVNGYEVHQGQWGTSILLAGPPNWITLPDFSNEQSAENEDVFENGGEE